MPAYHVDIKLDEDLVRSYVVLNAGDASEAREKAVDHVRDVLYADVQHIPDADVDDEVRADSVDLVIDAEADGE